MQRLYGKVCLITGVAQGLETAMAQVLAHAVLFLASEESSFVTGSELLVDGAWTAR